MAEVSTTIQEAQKMVEVFHACAKSKIGYKPEFPDEATQLLRGALIAEELDELQDATTIEEVADAIGDLLYVVLGAAVAYGISIEPIFCEIHKSNMSKFKDGYTAPNGKWMKGPSYTPPNLKPLIEEQSK